jgi:hypothetical protein
MMLKHEDFSRKNQLLISHLAGLILFFLPLSKAIPNILLLPFSIIVVYSIMQQKKIKCFIEPQIIFIGFAVLILFVLAIVKGSLISDLTIFIRYFTLITLFFLFSFVKKIRLVENYYLIGIIIAMFLSGYNIINYLNQNPYFLFTTGETINEILWEDRPYASFSIVIAVFICLRRLSLNPKKNWSFIILFLLLFGFCSYISARLSIFLSIVTFYYFLFWRTNISKYIKFVIILFSIIILSTSFIINKALIARTPLDSETKIEKIISKAKDREPRYVIWSCSKKILQNELIFWYGFTSYTEYRSNLVECYGNFIVNREEKKEYYIKSRYNSHNQFFDFWLNGGIFPFLFLFASFMHVFFSNKINSNVKFIYFLFFCFFLIENVIYRQMGYYLFGIFAVLYNNIQTQK